MLGLFNCGNSGLKFIPQDRSLSKRIKFKILESFVNPVLLYGCQTWAWTQRQMERLRICQRKTETRILNDKLNDRIPNSEVRERSRMKDVGNQVQELKWKWRGHMARLQQDRWAHPTTVWDIRNGKRKRGCSKCRWADDFQTAVGAGWTRTAKDRVQRKTLRRTLAKRSAVTYNRSKVENCEKDVKKF